MVATRCKQVLGDAFQSAIADGEAAQFFTPEAVISQLAAVRLDEKCDAARKKIELVGGLVGGIEKAPQLSAEEILKLKALLNSL